MKNRNKTIVKSGTRLGTLVFLILFAIKILSIAGAIGGDFSWLTWFWVIFPFWIGPAVALGIVVVSVLLAVIIGVIAGLVS